MTYTLWKKTEKHTTGCPEDESESSTYKSQYILVAEKDADDFGESCASDYGDQDYGYQVSYKEVAKFYDRNALAEVVKVINAELGKNICKYCQTNTNKGSVGVRKSRTTNHHQPKKKECDKKWI